MKSLISIILPAYNVEKYIEAAVTSILNQTYQNFEVIIVNDGSTDNTQKICEQLKEKDIRIILINQINLGSGIARNSGLKVSNGEYIYFMDPDDVINSNLLEENLRIAEKTNVEIVTFGYKSIRWNGTINKIKSPVMYIKSKSEFENKFVELYKTGLLLAVWNKLYKRSFLIENNLFFEPLSTGQDALFNLEAYKKEFHMYVNDKIYYNYFFHKESAYNRYNSEKIHNEIKIQNSIVDLVNGFSNTKHNDFIDYLWLKILQKEIANINNPSSPLSFYSKAKEILNLTQMKEFSRGLKNSKGNIHINKDKKLRIISLLIKYKLDIVLIPIYGVKSASLKGNDT